MMRILRQTGAVSFRTKTLCLFSEQRISFDIMTTGDDGRWFIPLPSIICVYFQQIESSTCGKPFPQPPPNQYLIEFVHLRLRVPPPKLAIAYQPSDTANHHLAMGSTAFATITVHRHHYSVHRDSWTVFPPPLELLQLYATCRALFLASIPKVVALCPCRYREIQ